jgi:uncharacterized 2Fe-2S/4Fe-4S cluster protein (DUF4445 family)
MRTTTHTIRFEPPGATAQVPTGALLLEAARQAGLDLNVPCGGQGRCGRCAVIVHNGAMLRRRSTVRLSAADLDAGYALACQTVVEGDAVITVPPQEQIERRLVTDKTVAAVVLPFAYDPSQHQPLRLLPLALDPPSISDQTDDWSRLKRALAARYGIPDLVADLPTLRRVGPALREHDWNIGLVVETDAWDHPNGPARLLDIHPHDEAAHLWGIALDIGTTTVSLYLVDLQTGEICTKAAEYNSQIKRGEDVISRIVYASKNGGLGELQALVVNTVNGLIAQATRRAHIRPEHIYKMTVAGNSTMIHLFLGLPPAAIRLQPFITTLNQPPGVRAAELGLHIHPQASVDCLPGVASYVGADITAGVISTTMCDEETLTLFLDIGTNGEMALGNSDWLVTCACSAGPAFEGAGVQDGMRATTAAIEEVWINSQTYEPTYRVIPNPRSEAHGLPTPPRGICGSGLIALLSEMFVTGAIDKRGNLNRHLDTPRIRDGEHGPEYVVAWAAESAHGKDIVITKVDIDNLMRAKGAVYAGLAVLAESVGIDLAQVERVLIGGAFGQYINVEKAIQIGLLPDLPWESFQFLGNTALRGALLALLNRDYRAKVSAAASKMTYLELSADNRFYGQFTSALFLPHTEIERFPSVAAESPPKAEEALS